MRRPRDARLVAAALFCLVLLLGVAACGRKAKPEPRSARLPAAIHRVSR